MNPGALTPWGLDAAKSDLRFRDMGKFQALALAHLMHLPPRVVIENLFAPRYDRAENTAISAMDRQIDVTLAIKALRKHLLSGQPASASHAEFTYEGVLDDTNRHQRILGIACGLAKTLFDDESVIYEQRGMSSGMEKGIEFANRVGRPVLHGTEVDLPLQFWRILPNEVSAIESAERSREIQMAVSL